ncbi:MAG: YCF48-related protein [Bacteroidales bacterium]|nr:YCF48-related protein [Bacteroidales bacterium]
MKKLISIVTMCVICSIYCLSQELETINITPLGFSGNFLKVVSLENKQVLALANNDCLYVSVDSARTWSVKEAPFKGAVELKKFDDGIYLYNSETIYRSIDNGISWNKFETNGIPKVLESYKMEYEHIFYKNTDTLFISATNRVNGSKIYRTTNGGKDWSLVAENLYSRNIYNGVVSLHFVSSQKGYAFGAGYYTESNDGGATWTKHVLENYETYFYDGIVTNGVLIQSYASSSVIVSDLQNVVWYKAGIHRFVSSSNKVIGNWNKTVHYTNDDGQTWQTKKNEIEDYFNDICCLDEKVMIQVGRNLTSYVTVDGGETWTKYVHGGGEGFNDIYAKNAKECFIAGKTGRMFHTKDGGETWEWRDLYTMGLKSITFPTQDTGYVISKNVLLMTTDGGKTWQQKTNKYNCGKIDFATAKVGFMGFVDEVLTKSTDYGNTWKYIGLGTNNKIYTENAKPYNFDFRNENEGLVTGKGNLLLHTTDGGQTWEIKETVPNNYYVWSVQNVADKGWLVSVGEEDFYGIFLCDNDFNSQLVFEGDGSDNSARYIICVNDSVYYQPINNTHYISRDYGLTWEDANFDIKGQRSFANEHLAYSIDFDGKLYKTYINVHDMGITMGEIRNRQIEFTTNVEENVFANVYIKDDNGNLHGLFPNYEIKKDIPCVIDLPQDLSDGSYKLFIESLNSAYKDTESEPFEVSDETAVLDVPLQSLYCLNNKTLYVYDATMKLYTITGEEIPIPNGVITLKSGVYMLVNGKETQKVIIK